MPQPFSIVAVCRFPSLKFDKKENDKLEADAEMMDGSIMGIEEASMVTKPCRCCEFA